jgi:hypothetical protein
MAAELFADGLLQTGRSLVGLLCQDRPGGFTGACQEVPPAAQPQQQRGGGAECGFFDVHLPVVLGRPRHMCARIQCGYTGPHGGTGHSYQLARVASARLPPRPCRPQCPAVAVELPASSVRDLSRTVRKVAGLPAAVALLHRSHVVQLPPGVVVAADQGERCRHEPGIARPDVSPVGTAGRDRGAVRERQHIDVDNSGAGHVRVRRLKPGHSRVVEAPPGVVQLIRRRHGRARQVPAGRVEKPGARLPAQARMRRDDDGRPVVIGHHGNVDCNSSAPESPWPPLNAITANRWPAVLGPTYAPRLHVCDGPSDALDCEKRN